MQERGHVLQTVPFGRDNWVTIAKPKMELQQRQELSISTDTTMFVTQSRTLGDLLQHCKRALIAMKRPDGSLRPFPEDEFNLLYGSPAAWKNWYELALFAKYKVKSEGFLNPDTDDWSGYAYKLREWATTQGFLPLEDPVMHELVPGFPTGIVQKFIKIPIDRKLSL